MSSRLAAYALCIDAGRVLLVLHIPANHWTLPGGGVEHGEDPIRSVIRELREETGREGTVVRLLGVDSRVIPGAERLEPGPNHHNVGVFYEVDIARSLTAHPGAPDEISDSRWVPLERVAELRRASLVDVGLRLAQELPQTGHVDPVPVGGLIEH